MLSSVSFFANKQSQKAAVAGSVMKERSPIHET